MDAKVSCHIKEKIVIKRFWKKEGEEERGSAVETARDHAENREMNKNNDFKAFPFFFWVSAFLSADAQLNGCSWLPGKCGEMGQFELKIAGLVQWPEEPMVLSVWQQFL